MRVLTVLADDPAAAGGTFHAVTPEPPTHEELRVVICKHLGLTGIELVDSAADLVDPSPLEREAIRMLEPYRDYLEQDVVFDDTNTRRVLAGAGAGPPPLDAAAIDRLIALALGG